MDHRPNLKAKTIKFLQENIRAIFHDLGFSNGFLNMTPKPQASKGKTNKFDFIKVKNFCASNGTI